MVFLQPQSKLCHCSWVGLKLFFASKLYLAINVSHLKDNTFYFLSVKNMIKKHRFISWRRVVRSDTQLERINKNLQKPFKDFGLKTAAESNLRIVNNLDLDTKSYQRLLRPYYKPDDIIQYFNKESSQPTNYIKHLPASIDKQFSNSSSDEKIFKEAAIYYKDTLKKGGYRNK